MVGISVFVFFSLVVSGIIFPSPTKAIEDGVSTYYNIVYTFSDSGDAEVSQAVKLENDVSSVYATRYIFMVSGADIGKVVAKDERGDLGVLVEKIEPNQSRVSVNLRDDVVGKGKSQSFNVAYTLFGLANKSGRMWQITIPRIEDSDLVSVINITVVVPLSFGKSAFISPQPDDFSMTGRYRVLSFNKQSVGDTSIVASFGEFQNYNFRLSYHLQNFSDAKKNFTVAIPPDTAYQKMLYTRIDPLPENVRVDEDGNWIAIFSLNKGEVVDVTAEGFVHVYATPQQFVKIAVDLEKYLTETRVWQVNDPSIRALAKKLNTPKAIYDYVVSNLKYNPERIELPPMRLGAIGAMANPQNAVCQEFTDLFIALSRSAGIPAREINGFGFTTNPKLKPLSLAGDILHSWPEYYDSGQNLWIAVDPTWGNTTGGQDYFNKFDTEHISFAIHGLDPDSPRPAGDYKTVVSGDRDVDIGLTDQAWVSDDKIEARFKFPLRLMPFATKKGTVVLTNKGASAIYNIELALTDSDIQTVLGKYNIDTLPPFGASGIEVKSIYRSKFVLKRPTIALTIRGERFVFVEPFAYYLAALLFLPAVVLFVGWVIFKKGQRGGYAYDS